MRAQDQLALSFRAAPDNYELPAYVLVSKPMGTHPAFLESI